MDLMHRQTHWLDEVTEEQDLFNFINHGDGTATITPRTGEVIQKGTPQNQDNFNNIEDGVQDVHIALATFGFGMIQWRRQLLALISEMGLDVTALRGRVETDEAAADALSAESAELSYAIGMLAFGNLQEQRRNEAQFAMLAAETLGEMHEITLTNTQKFPFNSTMDNPYTLALTTRRKNLFYSVEVEIVSYDGEVGEVHITDKALNGCKIAFDGPAKSATMIVRIKGGMT